MKTIRMLVLTAVVAAALAACSAMTPVPNLPNVPSVPAAVPEPPTVAQTAWVLAALPGQSLPAGSAPTLRFDADRISGSDGCNRIVGPYTASRGTLSFGPNLAGTMMACPEPARAVSDAFSQALARTRTYRMDGASLVLLDAGGTVLASFSPQATGLAGTAWYATAVNNGRQAVTGLVAGSRITLEFAPDGRVRGNGGCNTYSGPWTADGERLGIGPLITTRMACAQPEGVMAQESAFLAALQSVATARREGDVLELRTASGALAAGFRAAPASRR